MVWSESMLLDDYKHAIYEIYSVKSGVSYAKSQVTQFLHDKSMFHNFDFVMEIHSHSLFTHYWDVEIINEYNTAESLNSDTAINTYEDVGFAANTDFKTILTTNPSKASQMSKRRFNHNKGKTMNILCGTAVANPSLNTKMIKYSTSWEIKPPKCHKLNSGDDNIVKHRNAKRRNEKSIIPIPTYVQNHFDISTSIRSKSNQFKLDSLCEPLEVPFFSDLLSFSRIERLIDVPYDPYLETMTEADGFPFIYSIRLRTHGYKMYTPAQDIIYHSYSYESEKDKQYAKNIQDGTFNATQLKREAARLQFMLNMGSILTSKHKIQFMFPDIKNYGLGQNMKLDDYLKLVNVDLNKPSPTAGGNTLCSKIRTGVWKS